MSRDTVVSSLLQGLLKSPMLTTSAAYQLCKALLRSETEPLRDTLLLPFLGSSCLSSSQLVHHLKLFLPVLLT